jgi:hypothetical protein
MPHRFGRMPHPCRAPFRTICRNAASGPLEILQDFRCRIPRNVHVSDERGNQDQRDDPAPETAVRVGRTGRAIGPRGRELARRSAAGPCEARGAKRGRRRSGGRPERVPCRPVAARPAAAGGRVPADGPGDPPQVAPAARSSAARRMRVFVSGVMMDPPRERGGREDQGRSSSAKERDEGATTHVMYVCIFSSVGERKVRFRGFCEAVPPPPRTFPDRARSPADLLVAVSAICATDSGRRSLIQSNSYRRCTSPCHGLRPSRSPRPPDGPGASPSFGPRSGDGRRSGRRKRRDLEPVHELSDPCSTFRWTGRVNRLDRPNQEPRDGQ